LLSRCVRINPLPFVSTVDLVDTSGGSGAQCTVEYSISRIVSVRLKGHSFLPRGGIRCESRRGVIAG
jgi:hypothetical protein